MPTGDPCPHCNKPLSVIRRLLLGLGLSTTCKECGNLIAPSWPKMWSDQFAYVCFLLCGLSALFLFLAIEFMDQGWATLLGILVGVPLFMASIGALAFGIIYSILHWRNWRLLLLSFLSILLILMLIAEISPPILYNVAGSLYGFAVTVLSSYWLFKSR